MQSSASGFTVIEVLLFLAISGLLVLIAFAGVTSNVNNTRFNDAVRSTESFVQRQYNEVLTGKSDRNFALRCDTSGSITPGAASDPNRSQGMSNCTIIGRYILISGNKLTSRYVVGYSDNIGSISGDDVNAIKALSPKVAPQIAYESEFGVPWSLDVNKVVTEAGDGTYMGLAILRSPSSGNINFFAFPVSENEISPGNFSDLLRDATANKNTSICFTDGSLPGSRIGRVVLRAGQGSEVIQSDLTSTARSECS